MATVKYPSIKFTLFRLKTYEANGLFKKVATGLFTTTIRMYFFI